MLQLTKTVTRDKGKDSERVAEYVFPLVSVGKLVEDSKRTYVEVWESEEEVTQNLNTISGGDQMVIGRLVDVALQDLARQKAWEACGSGAETEKMIVAFEESAKSAYAGFELAVEGTDMVVPEFSTFRSKWLQKDAFADVKAHFESVEGVVKRSFVTVEEIRNMLPSFAKPEVK